MRVGKTPQAILAAHKAGARSVCVVCPAIAIPHWRRQFAQWWPHEEMLPHVQVMSYDKARTLWKEGLVGKVDVFIPDECHFAKNPEAVRTKMVYGKGGFAWNAGATWPLSGTPAPKHAAELWPMLRAFGVTKATYDQFVQAYCTVNADGVPTGTREKRIPELRAMLSQIMLRRTRKEVAPDMSDIAFDFLAIDPTTSADLKPEYRDCDTDDLEHYQSADREDRIAVAIAKAGPLAEEIAFSLEQGLYKQTVVFGWHREPLYYLVRRLREDHGVAVDVVTGDTSPTRRELVQSDFREGRLQVVVANIMAAGTAIDLSSASHGYFLELWWVGGDNLQAANRLISMDKKEPVTFDVVTWPGSVDDHVQQVLVRRMKQLRELMK